MKFLQSAGSKLEGDCRLGRNTRPDGSKHRSGGKKKLRLTSVAFVEVATCIGSYKGIENKKKIFVTNGHEIFR